MSLPSIKSPVDLACGEPINPWSITTIGKLELSLPKSLVTSLYSVPIPDGFLEKKNKAAFKANQS